MRTAHPLLHITDGRRLRGTHLRDDALVIQRLLASGRVWAAFWLIAAAAHCLLFYPAETWWAHSFRFVNAVSVEALVLGCLAAFQASLGMRKADPDDPL